MRKNPNLNGGTMCEGIFRIPDAVSMRARVSSAFLPAEQNRLFGVALQISGQLTLLIGGEE